MRIPTLSDELAQQAVDAYRAHGNSKRAAAASLGIPRNTFRDRLKIAAQRGMLGTAPVLPGYFVSKTTAVTNEDGGIVREFIQQKPEAGEQYQPIDGMALKGRTTWTNSDGRITQQVHMERASGSLSIDTIKSAIESALASWTARAPFIPPPQVCDRDLITIYPLADVHLGLRACADACGEEANLKLAAEKFRNTTRRLLSRSPNSGTALILQLGDWTHADDDLAMTPTSKHILQVSDDILPVVECGIELMVDLIYQALDKHERVIVKILPGNHDKNAWIGLYAALVQHFRDNSRVTIDRGRADYWFFRWGVNLLGAHHGHRLRPEEMAGSMATECREDWGETLYHIFLHGHLHHDLVKEVLGVRVECFRTMADGDRHHAGKYGSGKSVISITLHKEDGQDGRAYVDLPPVRRRAAQLEA